MSMWTETLNKLDFCSWIFSWFYSYIVKILKKRLNLKSSMEASQSQWLKSPLRFQYYIIWDSYIETVNVLCYGVSLFLFFNINSRLLVDRL